MTALYELTKELKECEQLLMAGELTEEMLADTLNALSSEFKSKAVNVGLFIKSVEQMSEACKNEQARLKDRQQSFDKKVEQMKTYLLENLIAIGETKITDPLITISTRKPTKACQIDDENKVPEQYVKTKTVTSIDKRTLLADLKNGEEIEGVSLIDGKQSITIK